MSEGKKDEVFWGFFCKCYQWEESTGFKPSNYSESFYYGALLWKKWKWRLFCFTWLNIGKELKLGCKAVQRKLF